MGGHDNDPTAPHQQRHRRFQNLFQVIHERGFIQDHQTLLAAQRSGDGRQGDDFEAGRKLDPECIDAFLGPVRIVEQKLFDLGNRDL